MLSEFLDFGASLGRLRPGEAGQRAQRCCSPRATAALGGSQRPAFRPTPLPGRLPAFVSSSATQALQHSPYLHHRIRAGLEERASVKINPNKADSGERSRSRSHLEEADDTEFEEGWDVGG